MGHDQIGGGGGRKADRHGSAAPVAV
jgi:hypothetical protein